MSGFRTLAEWADLLFGPLTREEIQDAIADDDWQTLREAMQGLTLEERHDRLEEYLEDCGGDRSSQIRVTNYVNALKRGGMIKRG